MTPTLAILDCHYIGDNAGRRATWGGPHGERARLEERLGRAFNRALGYELTDRGVDHIRVGSDSILPTTVSQSHLHKLACVIGADPVPAMCLEVHFNRAAPNLEGVHVQARQDSAEARQLAALIAREMARGIYRSKPWPQVLHPAHGYRESKLFGLLAAHSVPMVLVEAGNLDADKIRADLIDGGPWWRGFIGGVAEAVETWASGLWVDG